MSDKPVLPPKVVLLGEALHPLWLKLKEQMDAPASPIRDMPVMSEFMSRHLDKVADTAERLADVAVVKLNGVVMDTAVKEADVYRAVGGLETYLDELSAGYLEVRSLRAFGTDIEGRDLLADIYRHLLSEIHAWLGDICETIADPVASLKKRGLPTTDGGKLDFLLNLTASTPRELMLWMERQKQRVGKENLDFGQLIAQGYEKARVARTGQTVKKENIDFGLLIARGYEKAGPDRAKKERIKQEQEMARLAKAREERNRITRKRGLTVSARTSKERIEQEHETSNSTEARKERARYERELEQTREEVGLLTAVAGIALGVGIIGLFSGGDCDLDI